MALKIVYGSALSDRENEIYSDLISEALKNPDREYIMLVPEQASLTVQEELVRLHPDHALLNIDILNFQRLSHRVFSETSYPKKRIIRDTGKMMLLRLVLDECKDSLKSFRRNFRKPGFIDELKSVFSEFAQYNISPEDLRERQELLKDHPILKEKICELTFLYEAFLKKLHEHYEMAEEQMIHLSEALKDWTTLEKTTFYMDGFTGFTPPQMEVMEILIEKSGGVTLGVYMGSGEDISKNRNESDLFYMSAKMVSDLQKIANSKNKMFDESIAGNRSQNYTKEITHIERNVFRYPIKSYEEPMEHIELFRARKKREEVQAVAAKILEAVRQGYHYRDLAVVCGNLNGYRNEIHSAFQETGIAYFLDERRDFSMSPLYRFIQSLLQNSAKNFHYDTMFGFLTNPLVVRYLDEEKETDLYTGYELISEMENYATTLGIRGKNRYENDWTKTNQYFREERLPLINENRGKLIPPVLKFHETITNKSVTVSEKIEALREILKTFRVEETLQKMAKEKENAYLRLEYEKAWEYVQELFDECNEILSESILDFETFSDVLTTGLSAVFVGFSPATQDEIIVGDLRRTRLSNIKKLYVLGANEGALPEIKSGAGILSDSDRERLLETKLQLSNTVRFDSFISRFYLYLLFTKPTENLYISYSYSDGDGKSLSPSFAVTNLCSLFPDLKAGAVDANAVDFGNTKKEALTLFASDLRELSDQKKAGKEKMSDEKKRLLAIYNYFKEKPEYNVFLQEIFQSIFAIHEEETLSPENRRGLYEGVTLNSVSQLETYAQCAFRHFLRYGLSLKEQRVFEIAAVDTGTVLHAGIEFFFKSLKEENVNWVTMTEEEQSVHIRATLQAIAENYGNGILLDTHTNRYIAEKCYGILMCTVNELRKHWQIGKFETMLSEVEFDGQYYEKLRLELSNGLKVYLHGRIDRVDLLEDENRVLVKIMDYKSSSHALSMEELDLGTQLQLLLYLRAAEEIERKKNPGKEIIPAGVYYFHLQNPWCEIKDEKKTPQQLLETAMMLNGITNDDPSVIEAINSNALSEVAVVKGLRLKKDGTPYARAKVYPTSELQGLSDQALLKARELSENLTNGVIHVNPVKMEGEDDPSGCAYCPYHAICGFEIYGAGYKVRTAKGEEDQ